jgi:hypothetical protein
MKAHAQWFTERFGQTLPEHFLFTTRSKGIVPYP